MYCIREQSQYPITFLCLYSNTLLPFFSRDDIFPHIHQFMAKVNSMKRETESFSLGFTNNICSDYKYHRINCLGSYECFLQTRGIVLPKAPSKHCAPYGKESSNVDSDILKLIPTCVLQTIAITICDLAEHFMSDPSTSYDENAYTESEEDKRFGSKRRAYRMEFWNLLGMKSTDARFNFFHAEGIAFVCEHLISFHKDKMNDPSKNFNRTLSLKCKIPITAELLNTSALANRLMNKFGLSVGDSLPLSMMIYSRVCVANSVLRHNKLQAILADSHDLLTKKIAESLCVLDNDTNYSRFSDDASAMHNLVGSTKEVRSVRYNKDSARCVDEAGEEWKINDGKPKLRQKNPKKGVLPQKPQYVGRFYKCNAANDKCVSNVFYH